MEKRLVQSKIKTDREAKVSADLPVVNGPKAWCSPTNIDTPSQAIFSREPLIDCRPTAKEGHKESCIAAV
jgi:hypothetical protein